MIGKFLKGKDRLRDANPEIRREAIQGLEPHKAQSLQTELADLALNDSDTPVRLACLEKLNDPDFLGTLLNQDVLTRAVAARMATLISAGSPCGLGNHPLVLQERLLIASSDEEAKTLIDDIAREVSDLEILQDLLLRCKQELREPLLALDQLQSADALTRLERRSRDHDKSLNRYARERLEHIKQVRQRGNMALQRASELASALTKHRKTERNTIYYQRQTILAQEFVNTVQTFEECAGILTKHGVVLESISKHEAVFANLDEEPREKSPESAPVAVADPFPDLVKDFEALHNSLMQGGPYSELSQRRQELTNAWLSAADNVQPEPAQHEVFETVSHTFRELTDAVERLESVKPLELAIATIPEQLPTDPTELPALWKSADRCRSLIRQAEQICKHVAWPQWAKPDPRYSEILLNINALQEDLLRVEAHEREQVANLEKLITTLIQEIDAGSSQSASGTLNKARKLSKGLPGRSLRTLDKNLNQQAARLAELRDWQAFATAPKREELCNAMQKLVEAPFNPPDQAQRIKRLRGDWNELGAINKADDRRLAERFNQLAERAFEPCRSYFGEQAKERRKNLSQREGICNQLESYLNSSDWETADMKAAEQIMRTARSEWRKHHPVDRTPGKPLEARFEKLQNRLHDLVKAAWVKNLQTKQAIVEEAKTISESGKDVGEKVRRAKELQQSWRAVGVTPRRADQNLWRQFRGYCDQIFATRDNEKQQADAAVQEAMKEAEALCEELSQLLDTTGPSNAEDNILRDLQQRFRKLHDIPPRNAKSFERQFDELVRDYRGLLREKAFEAQFVELSQLKTWDEMHSKREGAHQAGETTGFEELHSAFAGREALLKDEVPMKMLHMLTISAELAAGIEVPTEEHEVRLQVQVEALKRGLGQRRQGDDPMEMVARWCAAGPKLEGTENLRDRFFLAIEKYLRE